MRSANKGREADLETRKRKKREAKNKPNIRNEIRTENPFEYITN